MRFESYELWKGHMLYAAVVGRWFRCYRYFNRLFARGNRRREFMIVDEPFWRRICAGSHAARICTGTKRVEWL